MIESWRDFWFRPEHAYPLGLVRMGFGGLIVLWTLSLYPDLYDLFGTEGVASGATDDLWSLFDVLSDDRAVLISWAVLLAAAVMLTIGWHSRLAGVVLFVLVISFERRSWFVFNAGDGLIRVEALLLMVAGTGAALSLDRRRAGMPIWSAELRPPWALRLIQVQLSLVYLMSVVAKMTGETWPHGSAVSYALRLEDMLILRAPLWLYDDPLLVNVATWATLALELIIGVGVWNRRLRPWVLAVGVVMHVMIMVGIGVGFFTPAILVLYLAFVPPDALRRLPYRIRRRVNLVRS